MAEASKRKGGKPEIRFKGFDEEWQLYRVSEITKFHKQGYYTTEPYGDDKKYYLLRGTDLTGNKLILKDTPKINATENDYKSFKADVGDFLIVRSGTVGTYGIVDIDIPAIFGSYLIDFRFDQSLVTNEFFGYFYQGERFKTQLNQITQQSANTNINAENIKSTKILLSNLDEQKKISEYLQNLDTLLTHHQQQHTSLENLKKAMLEKMFPRDGADVPEIRFKGFEGAWTYSEFGNLVDFYQDPVETPHEGYMRLGIRSHAKGTFHNYVEKGKELEAAQMHRVVAGNFIVNITFGWEHAVAITSENDAGKLVSHRFPQFKFREGLVPEFFKYIILDEKFRHHLFLASPGGAGRNRVLKIDEMLRYVMSVPSEEEQRKITAYFQNLDSLISHQQKKIEHLKHLKSALLEKMFVSEAAA